MQVGDFGTAYFCSNNSSENSMENLRLCAYHSGMKCQVQIKERILMIIAGDYPDWSASHEWFRLCYFYGGNTL